MKLKPPAVDPAEPAALVANFPIDVLADGRTFVPVGAVADALGAMPEYVTNRAEAFGVAIIEVTTPAASRHDEPETRSGFRVDDAARLFKLCRSALDEHDARWHDYVSYRMERKRAAAEARRLAAAAAHEQALKRGRLFVARHNEEQRRRAAEEAAAAAGAQAAREGAPVPFEKWAG